MRTYYEVFVAAQQFYANHTLTYSATRKDLLPGQVVTVPLKQNSSLGIIARLADKPSFSAKPLEPSSIPPLPTTSLKLLEWMRDYYPAPQGHITQLFVPSSLPKDPALNQNSQQTAQKDVGPLASLTNEQLAAVKKINKDGTYMLHGETGSGKTHIYQELALSSIKAGKSVLILAPEISLSSQLFYNFYKFFGERVVLAHSHLTNTERRTAWLKSLLSKEPLIIIGARSALFMPLAKLGLIVVDEFHEPAYKQEQSPHYHAVRVAGKLASLHKAKLVLGSATPSVTDYYIAEQKKFPIIRLKKLGLPQKQTKLTIDIVDLKDRQLKSRSPYLSNRLLQAIEETLKRNEQALLFLNRRGTARIILCQNCGWQALCPRCDIPLVYHGDVHAMFCHVCNYKAAAVSSCPQCHGTNILYKGAGTKTIVEEVGRLFPQARIKRFDTDNLKSERFEQHYSAIKDGEADILVGTQTLAKGLDLPLLGLVGVIMADSGLYIPDYLAGERTYQLISQVIGRVGRGHRDGQVVIQTYAPNNPLILNAISKDWHKFYEAELSERKKFLYPPFCYLLKLSCRRASPAAASRAADNLVSLFKSMDYNFIISGPAPAFHEKHGQKFEWQIILKSKNRSDLLQIIKSLPGGWSYDIDPLNLL